ncbi:MAG: phosphomethylpyrimidine synthase, partial [Hyphomicrobiales bacterium]|nr:phosphomethylpyrimidine synthase [Hyphomicrobiales bacterium]
MNKPVSPADLVTPKVTTGGIIGSRKAYSAPDAAPDLRVPIREIVLDPSSGEPPVPVYDPSGPYTDDNVAIDVERGLKRIRVEWIKERGGIEEYDGRPIQPIDNGNVTGKHLARNFPNTPKPMRAVSPSLPSPLWGGSLAEGERGGGRSEFTRTTPTPNPSPQGGGEQVGASGPHPITQLEWARRGIITKEMIYVAERE